jgi:hypothetical protein
MNLTFATIADDPKHVIASGECPMCGEDITLKLEVAQLRQWHRMGGNLSVQQAFPTLSPDDREFLISQTCGKCYDRLFGE